MQSVRKPKSAGVVAFEPKRSGQAPKRPNALTHGAFSSLPILRGENPKQFEMLLGELMEEWKPVGRTENDYVLTIANAIWRKRRFQKIQEVIVTRKMLDPSDPAYDENVALQLLSSKLKGSPKTAFRDCGPALRQSRIKYFDAIFPQSSFTTTADWAQAIIDHIDKIAPSKDETPQEITATIEFMSTALALTPDLLEQELYLLERLDGMRDRAVKRLIELKAMKQMLGREEH